MNKIMRVVLVEPGKKADLVVCDENWVRKEVLLGGKRVVKP